MTCGEVLLTRNVTCEMENLKYVAPEIWRISNVADEEFQGGGSGDTQSSQI